MLKLQEVNCLRFCYSTSSNLSLYDALFVSICCMGFFQYSSLYSPRPPSVWAFHALFFFHLSSSLSFPLLCMCLSHNASTLSFSLLCMCLSHVVFSICFLHFLSLSSVCASHTFSSVFFTLFPFSLIIAPLIIQICATSSKCVFLSIQLYIQFAYLSVSFCLSLSSSCCYFANGFWVFFFHMLKSSASSLNTDYYRFSQRAFSFWTSCIFK